MRSCEDCKHLGINQHNQDYMCGHPDIDWQEVPIYDENDLRIGIQFDPAWSLNSAVDCDFYEVE